MTPDRILARMAKECSKREYSSFDMRRKLTSWRVPSADIEYIVSSLEREGYISDSRFAKAFAHDKFHLNGWGRLKIARALKLKELPDSCIQAALAQIGESEYRQKLRSLLQMKAAALADKPPLKQIVKLTAYGASHGFESELIMAETGHVLNIDAGGPQENIP